jgi:hypothetical protein
MVHGFDPPSSGDDAPGAPAFFRAGAGKKKATKARVPSWPKAARSHPCGRSEHA